MVKKSDCGKTQARLSRWGASRGDWPFSARPLPMGDGSWEFGYFRFGRSEKEGPLPPGEGARRAGEGRKIASRAVRKPSDESSATLLPRRKLVAIAYPT